MGEELLYHQIEIDYHIQPKTVGLNHVLAMFPTLFVIVQLFVYCASLGSQTHEFFDSEMLNPGGQV